MNNDILITMTTCNKARDKPRTKPKRSVRRIIVILTALFIVIFFCSTTWTLHTYVANLALNRNYLGNNYPSSNGNEHNKAVRKKKKTTEKLMYDKSIYIDQSSKYASLREKYNSVFGYSNSTNGTLDLYFQELLSGRTQYNPISSAIRSMSYDPLNCPEDVPEGYPMAWNVEDVLTNWQPDEPGALKNRGEYSIYQGVCVFQYEVDSIEKILRYRDAEVPYVVRGDFEVLETVQRWSHPDYLRDLLQNIPQKTEFSENNHFMFWKKGRQEPKGWSPPTDMIEMGYLDWLQKAVVDENELTTKDPHWYYRINSAPVKHRAQAKLLQQNKEIPINHFLYDELPFFRPTPSLYMVEPEDERGINCRFGMKGVIAENHFDASRNSIVILFGERRYMLASPRECEYFELYPVGHPSGRHSAVDWSNPDYKKFPKFRKAKVNEIVLQAGDVMYLPKNWFHYIISIDRNYQCNIRSGTNLSSRHHFRLEDPIRKCMG